MSSRPDPTCPHPTPLSTLVQSARTPPATAQPTSVSRLHSPAIQLVPTRGQKPESTGPPPAIKYAREAERGAADVSRTLARAFAKLRRHITLPAQIKQRLPAPLPSEGLAATSSRTVWNVRRRRRAPAIRGASRLPVAVRVCLPTGRTSPDEATTPYIPASSTKGKLLAGHLNWGDCTFRSLVLHALYVHALLLSLAFFFYLWLWSFLPFSAKALRLAAAVFTNFFPFRFAEASV